MYYQYKEENNMPKALGYSTLVMVLLLVIGFFIVFGRPELEQYGMGGIIVNYGTTEEGMGDDYMNIEEPSVDENANNVRPDRVVPTETPTPTPTQQVSDKAVATQDMEDAPAVTKAEKPVKTTAPETTKETKNSTPAINTNALYKGKKNDGSGSGDGTGSTPGNQGSALGDPLASNYGDGGSGFGDQPISLESRVWAVRPRIQDDGQFSGVVVSEVTIDRNGNVINVRSGVKGTTYSSSSVNEMLNRELRKGKFNAIPNAPARRTVLIRIEFKLR
ncbi:energy transducer TonB [Sphingobacterium sp. SGG-5]|uniref:energy transducer TonB family protein n=1 Tax=Sphingobacterium sp. SGG-5 TaxID=2710881 RepID=UPI0013ED3FEC|nr:energy transducer TonB [Sphingobacterium sp. SGG-5]NGM63600.1 energy transducer TonB [Sphingobacterium sp. SGG-5]